MQTQEQEYTARLLPKVDLERRRLFLEGAMRSPLPAIIMAACLAWYLAPSVGRTDAIVWGAFIAIIFLVRLLGVRWVLKSDASTPNEPWVSWFMCGTGVMIGLASMYSSLAWFPILKESERAILTMVNVGWVAGGLAAQGGYPPWVPFWVVPIILGAVASWAVVGGPLGWGIAGLTIIVTLLMTGGLMGSAKAIKESILAKQINAELADQLLAQKSLVENAAQAKTAFLVAASHDLRQPAMGMGLLISALQGATDLPTAKRIGASAERALGAMERILQSLLEFSKLESGQVTVRKTPFNLHQVVRALVEEVSATLEAGVVVQVDSRPAMIVSDQSLFEQILRNLLSNAIRFTPSGTVTVSTESSVGGSEVIVKVIDTGIGIPEDAQKSIFKEYFQVNSNAGRRTKGLGLGLSIVEKAAGLLGATITVTSKIGEGSTFAVAIPAEILATNNKPQRMETASYHSESNRLAGQSILIVDDDTLVRDSFQTMLETYGATVVVCSDSEEAMKTLADQGPSIRLAFIDYQISDEYSGIDLIEAIRSQWTHVECVLVTGDVRKEVGEKAKGLGIRVLYKPLRIQKLIEVIEA